MDAITEYARAIEAGDVLVGEKVRKVYARLADEIAQGGRGRWIYDDSRAQRALGFARFIRQSKGPWAGRPLVLELWQRAFVSAIFGFVDKDTGERRFTEALLSLGRKGGKSTLAAFILLYLFVCEGQADIYTAATKLDQASLIYEEALAMVQQSPFLRKRIRKRRADMWLEATRSKFKPLGRNSNSLDGLNAKAVCVDELHGLEGPNGRNLVEVLRQAQSAAVSPLFLMTTTAGYVRGGIYDDEYELAAGIIDGTITGDAADRFLPVIYELDEADEWRQTPGDDGRLADGSISPWFKANPSLEPFGHVKKIDFLRSECARAAAHDVDVVGLLTKDFNVPQSGQGAWLQYADFVNHATFDLEACRGKFAIAGVDLSKCGDLTSATILMPDEGDRMLCHQMYWIPSEGLAERITHDKVPYDRWIARGLVRTCEGGVIRTDDVTAWFQEIVADRDISVLEVRYDAWSATAWVDQMRRLGFRMVPCHQGAKTLSLPLEHLEDALRGRRINYGGNPVLEWCISNATLRFDANGNRILAKNASSRHRIDGAASLLDAMVGVCDTPDFFDL